MLKFFREKRIVKGIFWALVIFILPAFVVWEGGSMLRSRWKGLTYVGTVDGEKVSFGELSKNMAGVRSQLILNYFNQTKTLDEFSNNKPLLAQFGWKRLVLLKEAKTHNIKISDREVINYIQKHPVFVMGGRFDQKTYNHVLKYTLGLGPRDFEEIVRENLVIEGLKDIISQGIKVSEEEVLKEYKRENEKIKISYILISKKDFLDKTKIDDNIVKDYYEKHKLEFMLSLPKTGENAAIPDFEDVMNGIRKHLAENEARLMAVKYAQDLHKKIAETMEKENVKFETAVSKLGLKVAESKLLSKSDHIEGLGEADYLIEVALTFTKPDQISSPVETKDGVIIFKRSGTEGIDEEKFKKDKDIYFKKVLEAKKFNKLEERFKNISPRTGLKINFQDIEKYYK
jgi:peptidyl-prolyl cis-trans isomerase D